jgi:hypothetical protein
MQSSMPSLFDSIAAFKSDAIELDKIDIPFAICSNLDIL